MIATISPTVTLASCTACSAAPRRCRIIESARPRATLYAYPALDLRARSAPRRRTGAGLTLLGFELELRQREGRGPDRLAAGRPAGSERLDRIAAFLNRPGQRSGGDVCEFAAKELHESGRRLLDE